MTDFQTKYDEALAAGLTKDQMRANCQKQMEQYERTAAERDEWVRLHPLTIQRDGEEWHAAAAKCREMLKWLELTK